MHHSSLENYPVAAPISGTLPIQPVGKAPPSFAGAPEGKSASPCCHGNPGRRDRIRVSRNGGKRSGVAREAQPAGCVGRGGRARARRCSGPGGVGVDAVGMDLTHLRVWRVLAE